MKTLVLALTLVSMLLSQKSLSNTQHLHPATHGLVLFGQEVLHASHIPTLHQPHAWQVITEFQFSSENALKIYQGNHKTGDQLITFRPKPFILEDLIEGKLKLLKVICLQETLNTALPVLPKTSLSKLKRSNGLRPYSILNQRNGQRSISILKTPISTPTWFI